MMRYRRWVILFSLLFLGQAAVVKEEVTFEEPSKLCSSPESELKSLKLSNLRQYERSGEQGRDQTTELNRRLRKYKLLLPEVLLQKGVSNLGELSRLQPAIQKLLNGEAITAVALGGSVSAGHGVIDPGNGWVARIFRWIEDTFPAAKHVLLNQAIPATTSGYVSACIPELVPANTDLVILEYTYNDYVFGNSSRTINNASRRGMERLLRRLIGHPNRPGILYMHYWPAARFQPPFLNDEDLVDILLKYYGIPTLSLKNAIHGLLIETPQLIDEIWWPEPDDKVHPTCIGARLMADLVIGHLQGYASTMQSHPRITANPETAALTDKLPLLLEGNWVHNQTACILEEDFPKLATHNKGWSWVDEGKTVRQHKWGFISTQPGARLELRVPLEQLGSSHMHEQFLVGIGGLISYQHMGSMKLNCKGGCSCLSLTYNMHHAQNFSMTGWRYLEVTRFSHKPCLLEATNAFQTNSGEHKVKVSTLMISARAT